MSSRSPSGSSAPSSSASKADPVGHIPGQEERKSNLWPRLREAKVKPLRWGNPSCVCLRSDIAYLRELFQIT